MLNPARPFLISLRQRDLRVLFSGLVISQAGDWLYNLALLAFVYERTGSRRSGSGSRPQRASCRRSCWDRSAACSATATTVA